MTAAEDERPKVAAWLELLAADRDHVGGTPRPTGHLGTTLQPDDEDYQPPVENLFEVKFAPAPRY